MAGIYLHVPFCKKKCHYCDFYSNTRIELSDNLIQSEIAEINLRKEYLKGEDIQSIYFGGGSPSMLSISEVSRLIEHLFAVFNVSDTAEITFEANPDDLDQSYLTGLRSLGVNRLSIGIQSFNDQVLKFLNRRHTSKQAKDTIRWARESGFDNISLDFIFGIPDVPDQVYKASLLKGTSFEVEHISAYNLNIEPGTVFYKMLEIGKMKTLAEENILQQFDYTIETLKEKGYLHYEVSNYAKSGFQSNHNRIYWNNGKYLGIGPSAHSYDGESRQWNIDHTTQYIEHLKGKSEFFEREVLTEENKYNEYILTRLRTSDGISEKYIANNYDIQIYNHFKKSLKSIENKEYIINLPNGNFALRKKGIFILDYIVKIFYYS